MVAISGKIALGLAALSLALSWVIRQTSQRRLVLMGRQGAKHAVASAVLLVGYPAKSSTHWSALKLVLLCLSALVSDHACLTGIFKSRNGTRRVAQAGALAVMELDGCNVFDDRRSHSSDAVPGRGEFLGLLRESVLPGDRLGTAGKVGSFFSGSRLERES